MFSCRITTFPSDNSSMVDRIPTTFWSCVVHATMMMGGGMRVYMGIHGWQFVYIQVKLYTLGTIVGYDMFAYLWVGTFPRYMRYIRRIYAPPTDGSNFDDPVRNVRIFTYPPTVCSIHGGYTRPELGGYPNNTLNVRVQAIPMVHYIRSGSIANIHPTGYTAHPQCIISKFRSPISNWTFSRY